MKFVIFNANSKVCPGTLFCCVLIEPTKMSVDAGMKSADDIVEYFLLKTHFADIASAFKAVLLVDQLPDVGTIIISEGFNVTMDIEVFPEIVCLIFHMPHPTRFAIISFDSPQILSLGVRNYFLRVSPKIGNFFIITSANSTTSTLTYLFHCT